MFNLAHGFTWYSTVVFLDMNGFRADLTDDEAYELVMDVAKGLADVADIAPRLNLARR